MTHAHSDDARRELAVDWLARALPDCRFNLRPLAGDASFRRYFRVHGEDRDYVLMDAPPGREDCRPFVDIAGRLHAAGLHAPEILAAELDAGLLLLEDLGDGLFRDILDTNNADQWFPRFFDVLAAMVRDVDPAGLPAYDRNRLLMELELFTTWYLERHKALRLSCDDWDVWEELCTLLIQNALQQPQVFVHRDFHSCNLLRLADDAIGIIDFQDAVRGPVTYDFISLVWDRYIAWPRRRIEAWMEAYRARVANDVEPADWMRWCDWMGLQRNLKVVGIFARLFHRDGKPEYPEMIPQFYGYVQDTLPRYTEFGPFRELLERLECAP